nr:ATP-binding cassette domain-containing protein [Paraoerskovia sediminicola]
MDLQIAPGEVVALLGPNGAGKSTLADAVAGLLPTRRGDEVLVETVLDETVVDENVLDGAVLKERPAPAPRRPREALDPRPHRRRVAWLGQRPLLLDHLDVRDNVAFGPRAQGAGRTGSRAAATTALAAVGAEHLAGRRPATLSGGRPSESPSRARS